MKRLDLIHYLERFGCGLLRERLHPAVESALADLNSTLSPGERGLMAWEVPFDFPAEADEKARAPFEAFHAARQALQKQMDRSIADHVDQETLYNQPAKSKDKLRITGPFSVEAVPFPIVALKAQMNTDLLTEDLKKARASNQSFWLMGQPDVAVRKRKDGLYEVEVNAFDYFDTAKGELVSGGKGEGWEKLKKRHPRRARRRIVRLEE